jgi:cytidine deaminase
MIEINASEYMRLVKQHGTIPAGDRDSDVFPFRAEELFEAILAAQNAYCPYSKFHVGAALLTDKLCVYAGCNVENVMYNGMSHAELTAISAAICAEGPGMKIKQMTIWCPTPEPIPSCGGCRQLIREHADSMDITVWSYCVDPTKPPLGITPEEMLPHSFGPEML